MNKLQKILLALILITIVFRSFSLENIPANLSNDEIGSAYDAYSISKTLKDEHDKFLPVLFESHGIYRSALAVYLNVPTIMIFGNTNFAARFSSAFLGSLTVVLLGLLVYELTKNKTLALLSSLFLAISPWHFSASHWLMEANYGLFFLVLGIYLLLSGLHKKNLYKIVGGFVSFALSIYSYYTYWALGPFILGGILVFFRAKYFKLKHFYLPFVVFCLVMIPLALSWIASLSSSRISTELIYKDTGLNKLIWENHYNNFQIAQIYFSAIIGKYSDYLNPAFIFFYGANLLPKENPYQVGFILAPLIVPFLFGITRLRKFFSLQETKFIYFWLLCSPFVPAVSRGDIFNVRALQIVAPISIVIAVGSIESFHFLRKRVLVQSLAVFALVLSVFYWWMIYFHYFPVQTAQGFQYGYREIAQYINENNNQYEKIIIDPRFGDKNYYFGGLPHEYIPYYTSLDPKKVQTAQKIPNGGLAFDKYEIREINWENETVNKKYLYVVPYDNIPLSNDLKQVSTVELPNHMPAFSLWSIQ